MSYPYITGAVSCSASTEYTGSFVKLTALASGSIEGNTNTIIPTSIFIDRIEFGQLSNPESDTTITGITGGIYLQPGQSIDGPIARFKVGANGHSKGVLAFFNRKNND